ncbi:hypothetical protein PBI_GRAVY_26 [Gordonia phage Gravy]|uniref:Uncharacterized protein n=2 Tax=Tanisvirus tanis TaxID=2844677 RepID=A0A2P1JYD5_9CAUD|nr:hypothetical protein PBI_GRAVY_26 [Gordonia phage Gravy]AVO25359.1 hypothetical protein PBI_KERRY_26 [Gordonia phage Kerry]
MKLVGAKAITDIRVGTKQAAVALAKHPNGQIREVYPVNRYASLTTEFDNPVDLGHFSMSRHDGLSNLLSGVSSGGAYRARLTSDPAKQYRFADQEFDGNDITIEFIAIDLSGLALASSVIINSYYLGGGMTEFFFGNDGFRLRTAGWDEATIFDETQARAIASGTKFTIRRILDCVYVSLNDVLVHTFKHASVKPDEGKISVGFSTSSNVSEVSSAFANLTITGSSTSNPFVGGRLDIPRISVARSSWVEIAYFYMALGGNVNISLVNYGWATSTSFSQRRGKVFLNGTEIIHLTNQNGGTQSANANMPANSLIAIQAFSDGVNSADRVLDDGYVEVYPVG